MKMLVFTVSLLLAGASLADSCMLCGAELESDWIECQGKSTTRDQAILKALKEGVSQIYGLNLSGSSKLDSASASETSRLDDEKHTSSSASTSFVEQVAAETEGRIKKWKMITEEQEGEFVKVHLHAKVINPRKDNVCSVMLLPVKVAKSLEHSDIALENKRHLSGAQIGLAVGEAMLGYLSGETDLLMRTPGALAASVEMTKLNELMIKGGLAAKTELQTMGEMLTTDYLLAVEVKDIQYKHKIGFDFKTGKAVPEDKFSLTLKLSLMNVKSGSVAGSATVTAELLNKDIVKLRAENADVKLLDAAMSVFADRLVEWTLESAASN